MTSPARNRRDKHQQRLAVITETEQKQRSADVSPFYEMTRADSILIRRAIRQRWPTTVEDQERIMNDMMRAIESDNDRLVISVARTVLAIDQEELKDQMRECRQQQRRKK